MASETYKKLLADVQDPDKGSQLITLNQLWKYLNTIDDGSTKSIMLSFSVVAGNPPTIEILNNPTSGTISASGSGGYFNITCSDDLSQYTKVVPIIQSVFIFGGFPLLAQISYNGLGSFLITTLLTDGTIVDADVTNAYVEIKLA